MVIVQFRGRLVRQYRACVVDFLGLGITCLISLYYVYKASQSCLLCFLCNPYIPHSNIYLSPLILKLQFLISNLLIILVQVSGNATSSKKIPRRKVGTNHVQYMYSTWTYVHRQMHVRAV